MNEDEDIKAGVEGLGESQRSEPDSGDPGASEAQSKDAPGEAYEAATPVAPAAAEDEENVTPYKPGPLVAVLGEVRFAGIGVIQALHGMGSPVRVLCEDEAAAHAVETRLSAFSAAAFESSTAQAPKIETRIGSLEAPDLLASLLKDVDGLVYLSPLGLTGRKGDARSHVATIRRLLEGLEGRAHFRFAYLSTVAIDSKSTARCIMESMEVEELLQKSKIQAYVFRAGPLMGRGDEIFTDVANRAGSPNPFMLVWGYGDTMLQPIHVNDMGRCVARAFYDKPKPLAPKVYAIAGTESVSLLELLDMTLESVGRFKIKFHIPGLLLKLFALIKGQGFKERVELMTASFGSSQNDAPELLGPHHGLKTLRQMRDEVIGVR